jgi:hypothetical protein
MKSSNRAVAKVPVMPKRYVQGLKPFPLSP